MGDKPELPHKLTLNERKVLNDEADVITSEFRHFVLIFCVDGRTVIDKFAAVGSIEPCEKV